MTYDAATETNPLYIIAAVYISGPLRGSTCFCLHSSNICRSPVNLLSRRTVIWMTVLPLSKFLQRRFRQILEIFALLSWKQNPRHVFTLLYAKEKFSLIARDCKMIEHRSRWSFCRNFHNIGYIRLEESLEPLLRLRIEEEKWRNSLVFEIYFHFATKKNFTSLLSQESNLRIKEVWSILTFLIKKNIISIHIY